MDGAKPPAFGFVRHPCPPKSSANCLRYRRRAAKAPVFRSATSARVRLCCARHSLGGNIMRVLIAGILGGIAMYIVLSVMHLSPLGQVGVHAMPNGDAVVAQISDAAGGKGGLYFAPDHMSAKPSSAKGPFALVAFTPSAPTGLSPMQLTFEFFSELVEALIAAWLLAQAGLAAYGARVAFVTGIG